MRVQQFDNPFGLRPDLARAVELVIEGAPAEAKEGCGLPCGEAAILEPLAKLSGGHAAPDRRWPLSNIQCIHASRLPK